ncbi:hypothetical protein [Candidatus Anaplasma sp. TIGMIC]|uniref:hypothetical protein n=1 Tax=Candidatus Anaplasma sp. TIGMIC TaxID=3020713 RepID=UPI00232A7BBD|nr:hypothetical protein [Candidatus Anaplasma sp. TIGMIC]MDB1135426.1 hypothetical protein [Candidatus Anaplasma sp. TIGMIC]
MPNKNEEVQKSELTVSLRPEVGNDGTVSADVYENWRPCVGAGEMEATGASAASFYIGNAKETEKVGGDTPGPGREVGLDEVIDYATGGQDVSVACAESGQAESLQGESVGSAGEGGSVGAVNSGKPAAKAASMVARKSRVAQVRDAVAESIGFYFVVHALCWPLVLLLTVAAYILSRLHLVSHTSVLATTLGTFLATPIVILAVAAVATSLIPGASKAKAETKGEESVPLMPSDNVHARGGQVRMDRTAMLACVLTCVCSGTLAAVLVGCEAPFASVAVTTMAVLTAVGGLCFGVHMLTSIVLTPPSTYVDGARAEAQQGQCAGHQNCNDADGGGFVTMPYCPMV